MYLYGKIKFNEASHKRIGAGFSTRSDTNQAVQPQEMTDRACNVSKGCTVYTVYTEKTMALIRYFIYVHLCFCTYDQEVTLITERYSICA